MRAVPDLIQRVRAEYMEMPGLRLTAEQVQRLCGIERMVCQIVLDGLVAARFLRVEPDGRYSRVMERSVPSRRPPRVHSASDDESPRASSYGLIKRGA
jgi:hypothetical protein